MGIEVKDMVRTWVFSGLAEKKAGLEAGIRDRGEKASRKCGNRTKSRNVESGIA